MHLDNGDQFHRNVSQLVSNSLGNLVISTSCLVWPNIANLTVKLNGPEITSFFLRCTL